MQTHEQFDFVFPGTVRTDGPASQDELTEPVCGNSAVAFGFQLKPGLCGFDRLLRSGLHLSLLSR